jgi:hypothetical protein
MKRTPLKSKAAKPKRTTSPRCKRQRCNKRAEIEGMCVSHAEEEADQSFQTWVKQRDGWMCTAVGVLPHTCLPVMQAAHIVGRRNHTVRYDPQNVHCLCLAAHKLVDQTGREHAKYRWAVSILGEDGYADLMDRAIPITDRRLSIEMALEESWV